MMVVVSEWFAPVVTRTASMTAVWVERFAGRSPGSADPRELELLTALRTFKLWYNLVPRLFRRDGRVDPPDASP